MGVTFGAKPPVVAAPIAHPTLPGCQFLLPFVTSGSAMTNQAAADVPVTVAVTGAPTWQSGPCGPQLGGFTTSDYLSASAVLTTVSLALPFWVAAVVVNTNSTTDGFALSLGYGSVSSPVVGIRYNDGGTANKCSYFLRDNAAAGPDTFGASVAAASDGGPHLLSGASYTATDHRLYFDGIPIATNTTSIGSMTLLNKVAVGVLSRTSIQLPLAGSVVWAAFGQGAVPNFGDLYARMWEHLQPQRRSRYAPGAVATGNLFYPATLSLGSGGPFFATPVNG